MDSYTWLPPGASNASARYHGLIQTHPLSTSPSLTPPGLALCTNNRSLFLPSLFFSVAFPFSAQAEEGGVWQLVQAHLWMVKWEACLVRKEDKKQLIFV